MTGANYTVLYFATPYSPGDAQVEVFSDFAQAILRAEDQVAQYRALQQLDVITVATVAVYEGRSTTPFFSWDSLSNVIE